MPSISLLPVLAVAALLSLVSAGALLLTTTFAPQLAAHLGFALGVLPLILAAIGYFVPVLTRSGTAGPVASWPALMAWAGGALAVFAFATDFSPTLLSAAATLGGMAAAGLGVWTLNLTRQMLGSRHRGLDWYLAALGFLLLALLAVMLMPLFPAQRTALKLFHLHANLLGFIGLAALGTLQVLLPTCLGQFDPEAGVRLRRDLKWAVAGTLLVAVGSASPLPSPLSVAGPALAVLGALLYARVVIRLLRGWLFTYGKLVLQVHGAAPSLAAATLGLLGLLALGIAHGVGGLPARPAVAGFVIAILLPLVSGAAAQLAPVWLRPGMQGPWHHELRRRLGRWGGVRGLLLVLLGLVITVVS